MGIPAVGEAAVGRADVGGVGSVGVPSSDCSGLAGTKAASGAGIGAEAGLDWDGKDEATVPPLPPRGLLLPSKP